MINEDANKQAIKLILPPEYEDMVLKLAETRCKKNRPRVLRSIRTAKSKPHRQASVRLTDSAHNGIQNIFKEIENLLRRSEEKVTAIKSDTSLIYNFDEFYLTSLGVQRSLSDLPKSYWE